MAKEKTKTKKKNEPKKTEEKNSGLLGIKKPTEFEKYAFFLSLPATERDQTFGYHTEADFAKENKVHPGTLTEWKHDDRVWEKRDLYMRSFRRFTADVIAALARRAMKAGYAFEVQTWMKLVEGWNEKSTVDITSRGKKVTGFKVVVHHAKDGTAWAGKPPIGGGKE